MGHDEFQYSRESANQGHGHGKDRSNLVSAFIKYGKSLDRFHELYPNEDLRVIQQVVNEDHGMLQGFGYKLNIKPRSNVTNA
jgi:hypothetical protein